jgi:serine/threonine-protein kinase
MAARPAANAYQPFGASAQVTTARDWRMATPRSGGRSGSGRQPASARAAKPDASVSPGAIVAGKYRVEHVLGEGGMGVVVEATHLGLGQRFALKLLHRDLGDVEELCERFLHEARIAARLPGEHVARAVDVGRTEQGQPYLVMELLVGRDLGAELDSRGRLPVAEAVDYVLQACEGVAELHALGIVHRDLKPANLFLTRRRDGSPLVKVLDFGIAKWAVDAARWRAIADVPRHGAGPRVSTSCGTPTYMAPEQLDEAQAIDGRCDQHALAVVLYELITGSAPFSGNSVAAILLSLTQVHPASLCEVVPDAPVGLASALTRAFAKQPAERFADLGELARAIAPFGGPEAMASARNVAAILAGAAPGERTFQSSDPALQPTCPGDMPPPRRRWLRRLAELTAVGAAFGAVVATGLLLDAHAAQPRAARMAVPELVAASARALAPSQPAPSDRSVRQGGDGSPSTQLTASSVPSAFGDAAARRAERKGGASSPSAQAPRASASAVSAAPRAAKPAAPTAAPTERRAPPRAASQPIVPSAREVFGARR